MFGKLEEAFSAGKWPSRTGKSRRSQSQSLSEENKDGSGAKEAKEAKDQAKDSTPFACYNYSSPGPPKLSGPDAQNRRLMSWISGG